MRSNVSKQCFGERLQPHRLNRTSRARMTSSEDEMLFLVVFSTFRIAMLAPVEKISRGAKAKEVWIGGRLIERDVLGKGRTGDHDHEVWKRGQSRGIVTGIHSTPMEI